MASGYASRVRRQQDVSGPRGRAAITGIGVIAPNGTGIDTFWQACVAGESGVRALARFEAPGCRSGVAAAIEDFVPQDHMSPRVAKRTDRFAQLGIAAARMAIEDSCLSLGGGGREDIGVCVGSGLGGILFHEDQIAEAIRRSLASVRPTCVPSITPNAVAGQIAIQHGLKGINVSVSAACASGASALGYALDLIRLGRARAIITGGVEAPLTPYTFAAYDAMRVLSSKRNHQPERASRPFDRDRDGFVLGEGAGMLVVEDMESALRRQARIYAELVGFGSGSGAYNMVTPDPTGADAARAMEMALADAEMDKGGVGYINAHGTSTQANDRAETLAIKTVFGDRARSIPVSSTKSVIGHLIGAAGAVEAIVSTLAVESQVVPPTINLDEADPECDLDYVPHRARRHGFDLALCNSFGFGSCNACVALRRFDS